MLKARNSDVIDVDPPIKRLDSGFKIKKENGVDYLILDSDEEENTEVGSLCDLNSLISLFSLFRIKCCLHGPHILSNRTAPKIQSLREVLRR